MSQIKLSSNASGTGVFTLESPATNTNRTLTLPDATGTIITTAGGAAISGTTGTFTGLVDISAAGAGQIKFPATQNASSDANTLDDYEEGNWTITDQSGAGLTITNNTGRYVKVGRVVYITCFPTYPSTASGSTARLSLPFVVATEYSSLSKSYIGGASSQTNWLPLTDNGNAYFGFRAPDGGDTQATNANLSNKSVIVSGWYLT